MTAAIHATTGGGRTLRDVGIAVCVGGVASGTVNAAGGVAAGGGGGAERVAATTYFEFDEALARFQQILESMGITAAMDDAGVQVGDSVFIGDQELEWGE